ncbi:MAG TPA: rhomboid family intramembrane serine protease, partial [Desulfurivibrionaceae bacterium]|nr:rhomboid family intramembrane serine protease [Desulfurivibrionaceae bacterium]
MTAAHKNSLLCPNCRRLISRDEPKCPWCGIAHPGSRLKGLFAGRLFERPEQLLHLIIGVNVAMYVLSLLLNPATAGLAMNPFHFLSPDNRSLLLLGATGTLPINALGRWWSLFSASYLHGSLLHILFNMLALRQLLPLVAQEFGSARMFAIYTIGGIGGFLLSYLAGVRFTIGASAAVCGLIGAVLYYGKHRGGGYGQELFSQVGGWAIGIFAFGLLVPGINNWGHGGGMVAGALAAMLLGYRERSRETFFHKALAGTCGLATLAVLLW